MEKTNIFKSVYYRHVRVCMVIFGLWPYLPQFQAYLLRLCSVMLGSTIVVPTICKMVEFVKLGEDTLWAIPSQLYYVENYGKIVYVGFAQDRLRRLLDSIKHNFQTHKGKNLETLYRYAADANKMNFYYGAYVMTTVLIYSASVWTPQILDIAVPLNESRPRPIPRLIRYYSKRMDDNYNFIILHGMVIDTYFMFLFMGYDMLLVNCSQHACALFKIVMNDLKDCLEDNENDKGKFIEMKEISGHTGEQRFYNKIVLVIEAHKEALEFAAMINSAFSLINLFTIGVSFAAITLTEYETVIHLNNTGLLLRFTFFTVGEFFHILYYNFAGQTIEEHSLQVCKSCYECEWYRDDIPDECRQLLKLMIVRSQKPVNLNAGKIILLSLESFMKTVKMSLSFFTMLLSMH